jgi:hypothetical protein
MGFRPRLAIVYPRLILSTPRLFLSQTSYSNQTLFLTFWAMSTSHPSYKEAYFPTNRSVESERAKGNDGFGLSRGYPAADWARANGARFGVAGVSVHGTERALRRESRVHRFCNVV